MVIQIIAVTYLGDYCLQLEFSDGSVKNLNFRTKLYGELFEPLKNLDLFRQVRLNPETHTIEWPNGAYFSPEYLHEIGREVRKTA